MQFEVVVTDALSDMIGSGKVKELVAKQVEATVQEVVRKSLQSYSDFGKQIEEKLKESMNCTDIDFPDYSSKMVGLEKFG